MHRTVAYILATFTAVLLMSNITFAQWSADSSKKRVESRLSLPDSTQKKAAKDTAAKKPKSEASKAAFRAAVLPGWGQVYNKKYWKLPLVYGALAIPVVTFQYNLTWYQKTREAYTIRFYNDTSRVSDLPIDKIDPRLVPLSTGALRSYRNSFRQNVDYSVLFFLAMWGLQIVDATVDAHLRGFNISDDLSLKVKPVLAPGSCTGIGLVITQRDSRPEKPGIGF
jgi:hypothetical protein